MVVKFKAGKEMPERVLGLTGKIALVAVPL